MKGWGEDWLLWSTRARPDGPHPSAPSGRGGGGVPASAVELDFDGSRVRDGRLEPLPGTAPPPIFFPPCSSHDRRSHWLLENDKLDRT